MPLKIQWAIRRFRYERLQFVYGGAHDAIIGEWIRWWNEDVLKGSKYFVHSVINPAIQARYRGKRYYADILFAEHVTNQDRGKDIEGVERDFFRIVGVAEIENNNCLENLKRKVDSIYAYEKCRDRRRRIKFEDLEFGLLCTHYYDQDFKERKDEINKVKEYIREKSENSKLQWVLYLLKKILQDEEEDYFFRVSGYARDETRRSFYYDKAFYGKPEWYIFEDGRRLKLRY